MINPQKKVRVGHTASAVDPTLFSLMRPSVHAPLAEEQKCAHHTYMTSTHLLGLFDPTHIDTYYIDPTLTLPTFTKSMFSLSAKSEYFWHPLRCPFPPSGRHTWTDGRIQSVLYLMAQIATLPPPKLPRHFSSPRPSLPRSLDKWACCGTWMGTATLLGRPNEVSAECDLTT